MRLGRWVSGPVGGGAAKVLTLALDRNARKPRFSANARGTEGPGPPHNGTGRLANTMGLRRRRT